VLRQRGGRGVPGVAGGGVCGVRRGEQSRGVGAVAGLARRAGAGPEDAARARAVRPVLRPDPRRAPGRAARGRSGRVRRTGPGGRSARRSRVRPRQRGVSDARRHQEHDPGHHHGRHGDDGDDGGVGAGGAAPPAGRDGRRHGGARPRGGPRPLGHGA
jgi:hypothetical protein